METDKQERKKKTRKRRGFRKHSTISSQVKSSVGTYFSKTLGVQKSYVLVLTSHLAQHAVERYVVDSKINFLNPLKKKY
jgi:hypothetical protein